jgi:acyl transferase domain-containing protein/acyl carrier protein
MADTAEPVAVVGMACRLPGARDVEEFWRNLVGGTESVSFFDEDELRAAGVTEAELADPDYVRAAPMMPDVDMFDADLFGMTDVEASLCDPQIRVLIEMCHSGLENAGYDAFSPAHSVGVFGTVGPNGYLREIISRRPDLVEGSANLQLFSLNHADYATTLTSYTLDLRGPSMTVLTACSSSLVAVHLAAQALRAGECDMAIAGGAAVEFPIGHGHRWTPGAVYTRDGHCRPFDASASGTIFGSGAGVVVLKLLSDAIADGDDIRAVIRGSAVNNDGADKMSYSAPSVLGQSAAVAEAMALAAVRPADVDYVEAHATGTELGDPVEVSALATAYAALSDEPPAPGRTAIGSVKSNIGHLAAVAGVAGLIKTVLMLEREAIVPSIGVERLNPHLEIEDTPFAVATELRAWPSRPERRRTAAVSSLGIGGTNAHLVLSEAPAVVPRVAEPGVPRVLVWSAKTDAALEDGRQALAEFLATTAEQDLSDVLATLRHGRTAHPVRAAAVVESTQDAVTALSTPDRLVVATARRSETCLLFAGDAAVVARSAELYGTVRSFTIAMDECLDLIEAAGLSLYRSWPGGTTAEAVPALVFAIEYSLAAMVRGWGVTPAAVVGRSVGLLAAAASAGALDLPDAVALAVAWDSAGFADVLASLKPSAPTVALRAADGTEITVETLADCEFWLRPAGEGPVAVPDTGAEHTLLVELGSGTALPEATDQATGVPVLGTDDGRTAALRTAAVLWAHGVAIDWVATGQRPAVRRLAVPGYPYQRRRHWIDPTDAAVADEPLVEAPLCRIDWVEASRPAGQPGQGGALVVLPADPDRAVQVVRAVERAGLRAIRVRLGEEYGERRGEFVVRAGVPSDLAHVVSTLDDRGMVADVFVHAAGAGAGETQLARRLDVAHTSAFALAKLAVSRPPGRLVSRFVVITAGAVDVSGSDFIEPSRATALGLVRSLLAESPNLRGGVIDLAGRVEVADLAAELCVADPPDVVALRGRRRWTAVERPYTPDAGPEAVRDRGVYLITGGFGGLGLALAGKIVDSVAEPRLVLLGRRDPCATDDPATQGVRDQVAELRARGAEVMTVAADVTDLAAVRAALGRAVARFGPVSGLFQLAGVAGDRMIAFREPADATAVLAPKTTGTAVLEEAFADQPPLDFAVLYSSRAAADGLVGGADYAAANAFLDATAAVSTLAGGRVLSVGWPVWQGAGMVDHDGPDLTALAERVRDLHQASDVDGRVVWETELSPDTHWALDEHRLDGVPVLPGCGHLDLVVGAFAERLAEPGRAVELTDVVFRQLLLTDQPCTVRVTFTPAAQGYDFEVSTGEPARTVHCRGHVASVVAERRVVDVEAIRSRLVALSARVDESLAETSNLDVGPRWQNVTEVLDGGAEQLLRLDLMPAFASDLATHRLHPALLDMVTSATRTAAQSDFLPFLYRRLVLHAPLPIGFHGHIRRHPSGADSATGDLDLLADDGTVLVSIEGFTMRRAELGGGQASAVVPDEEPAVAGGLDPDEGLALLWRLLAAGTSGAVLVRGAGGQPPAMPSAPVAAPVTADRPEPAPAPAGAVESRLRELWGQVIGPGRDGPDDDFFDAGGDSLAAVELTAKIRAAFGIELSIGTLLDSRTFDALLAVVAEAAP